MNLEENASEDISSNQTKKKRKAMKPRSDVWQHFDKITNSDGELKVKCKHCLKIYAYESRNGTSGLNTHIKNCKSYNSDSIQTQISFKASKYGDGSLGVWKFDAQLARTTLAKMIILDELSFKFVDGEGFRQFIATVCPRFQIPSRWIIARNCFNLFNNGKDELKSLLNASNQRVCLSTDTWTSNQRINYMCLTAHFIDNDWKLHKKIINFCPIFSHKGEAISLLIEKCMREWDITKVMTITVDNASSNDVALGKLKAKMANWDCSVLRAEYLHMRCMTHILNLIVQDGLKEFNSSISKVRNVVRYVRMSPARLARFEKCKKLENIECKKGLALDVLTRWNSTYLMLDSTQVYERVFERFDEQDLGYKSDLQEEKYETRIDENGVTISERVVIDGRPTFDDWVTIRHFSSCLKMFYDLTLKISGTTYVTSNMFLHEIYRVYCTLQRWVSGSNPNLFDIGEMMLTKFKKYWGDPLKMNMILFVAMVLDPRHKLDFMIYLLKHMYRMEVGVLVGKKLRETLFRMFIEYKSRMEPTNLNLSNRSARKSPSLVVASDPLFEVRMQYEKESRSDGMSMIFGDDSSCPTDLDEYLSEKPKSLSHADEEFDVLGWWKFNSVRFPVLSQMARDVLAMPISTVASESAFSTGGRILNDFRSSLTPKVVEALLCAQDWIRKTEETNGAETIEEVEKLEKSFAKLTTNDDGSEIPVTIAGSSSGSASVSHMGGSSINMDTA